MPVFKYLDTNLEVGSTWTTDSLLLSQNFLMYKKITVNAKHFNFEYNNKIYDEVIEITEANGSMSPNNCGGKPCINDFIKYIYAQGIGVIKKEIDRPDNTSNVISLVEFGSN